MASEDVQVKLKVFGLEENTARAMCYVPVFGIIAAAVFLVLEKSQKLRWDAMQAIILWAGVMLADLLLVFSRILSAMVPLVNLIGLIVVPLLLAVRASQKEETRLPYVGEVVDKIIK